MHMQIQMSARSVASISDQNFSNMDKNIQFVVRFFVQVNI